MLTKSEIQEIMSDGYQYFLPLRVQALLKMIDQKLMEDHGYNVVEMLCGECKNCKSQLTIKAEASINQEQIDRYLDHKYIAYTKKEC